MTQAQTPFEQDVATSIDRGLDYLEGIGAFGPSPGSCNNFGDNSEARGLALLALLEKRASGNPGDPPQGYSGASAADKGRMRNAVACMLDWSDTMSALSYHNGNYLMGLSLYLRSGGPDKASLITSGEIPAGSAGNYDDLITAINRMVDRLTIAPNPQTANGYWGYTVPNVDDSSTTQLAPQPRKNQTKNASRGSVSRLQAKRIRAVDVPLVESLLIETQRREVEMRAGKVRSARHRFDQRSLRLGQSPHASLQNTQIVEHLTVVRVQFEAALVGARSFVEARRVEHNVAQIVVPGREIRIDFQRTFDEWKALIESPRLAQQHAKVVHRVRIFRPDVQQRAIQALGRLDLLATMQLRR